LRQNLFIQYAAWDMYLKKFFRLPRTLALRLTFWYATVFTLSSLFIYISFYFFFASVIRNNIDNSLLNEGSEISSLLAKRGIDEVKLTMDIEAEAEGIDKMFLRLLNDRGEELASSNKSSWGKIEIDRTALKELNDGTQSYVLKTALPPEYPSKTRILYIMIGNGIILQISLSLAKDEQLLLALREKFSVTITVILVLAALVGWFMARGALHGVEEVTQTAAEIAKGDLRRRVTVKDRGDEINRLAETFNSMVDRIYALITGMREMNDNIAHDMRSPITRIRGIAEMAITTDGSIGDYENMAASTIEECDFLLGMINTMLDITEIEAGSEKLTIKIVNIAELVRDACELFRPMAEDKGITINANVPETCYVNGDIQRLQRMIAHLIDNALKYTYVRGTVTVVLRLDEEQIILTVSDTGIGISETDLPHIFKRFYRCDHSRSQPGSGLGLSLSRAIARAHGGDITVKSSLEKGSTFTVALRKATLLLPEKYIYSDPI
jgi:signal transduction histidine kinase